MYKPTEGTIVGPVGFADVVVLVVRIVPAGVETVTLVFNVIEESGVVRTLLKAFPVEVVEELDKPAGDVVEAARLYNSSRLPAPQYSRLLPGHKKLQSAWFAALILPMPSVLPQ